MLGDMYSTVSRGGGFYKAPVVKALLVWTSANSFMYRILANRVSYPGVLWVLRCWALPSAGAWLAAAVILYSCKLLEQRTGSNKFMNFLLSAGAISAVAAAVLQPLSDTQFLSAHGTHLHVVAGMLVANYMTSVVPLHCYQFLYVRVSSNFPFYLLVLLFSCSSVNSMLSTLCGLVGGLTVYLTGPLPLPTPPSWSSSFFGWLLAPEPPPPPLFSGATLEVQRQQRMDQIERMMIHAYNNRQNVQYRLRQPRVHHPPSEAHVHQLVAMGFQRDEAYQALLHTASNVEGAVQLLTSRHRTR